MNSSAFRCLVPECDRTTPHSRGLCRLHYETASYLVKRGKTTWPRLEKEGKALAAYSQSSRSRDAEKFLGAEWLMKKRSRS